ncbi:cation diffusion facilitator family transporter [Roseateles amylovorans]|uniref:Cation diffusion facilitator family transporter n=1 Tax=Roseateles amylovorans TaxID=2978473 RepID=A0ABY6B3T5_9BURK|nr:cation diffusion facilitator family transporter [Roseateles amylovorans]UXH79722.1 cation diffusion facilitator family transporter [Roseateles amylovorans]
MQVQHYLKLSVVVALVTIALKTAAWWWTGSVGLLSDALESLVNLAGALFGLAMVTIARRPPDEDHPYGHHKAEYFSSAFEGALILIAALGIGWTAIDHFRTPQPLEQLGLGMALSLISTVINGALAWSMLKASRAHRSIALEADARHLFTDVWTSVGVVAGLVGVMLTGWTWLDPLLALLVAVNILREAVHLMSRSTGGLMDQALSSEEQQSIAGVLAGFSGPELRFDHVATRVAGQRRYVDLHLHLPARWTLGQAAALRGDVERALMRTLPGLRASIQLLPINVETRFEEVEREMEREVEREVERKREVNRQSDPDESRAQAPAMQTSQPNSSSAP